jgi:aminopeptidase S
MAHGTNSSTADFFRVRIVVGSTVTTVFEELGAANNDDAAWATGTVNLSQFAGQTIRILIEAADASTASLVEAGVDDVRITRQ